MKTATLKTSHPLTLGLRAARANLVPGLIVQILMAAVVCAYFFYPPAREWLSHLALLKQRYGYGYSLVSGIIAGAILPEILAVTVLQKGKITRETWERLIFTICYWGFQSMVVDAFYRFQGVLFGTDPNVATVVKKVLVDQFIYTAFYANPFAMVCFEWKNSGYRLAGVKRVFTREFYQTVTLPTLLANWGLWIPVVCMIYSLPPLLQLPLQNLALTFWAMLLTWMTRRKNG
ncbi:MAG: hypothetical protein ACFUZC_16140 [Chthoniobacteraceae bacterium]